MQSNCYLFLLRWNSSLPKSALEMAAFIPKIPTSVVRGDSLETPFMNFIKVDSVSHNIGGFGEGAGKDYSDLEKLNRGVFWHDEGDSQEAKWTNNKAGNSGNAWRYTGEAPMTEPGAMNGSLPEQQHFSFTKPLDSATPQLAYGCSTQEQYKIALFYYRRKVSFGVSAVQFPYMVVGMQNAIIRGWSLDDDSETITMSYDRICWGAISQFADTPVPQGISTRFFDRRTGSGGLVDTSALTAFVTTLTAAMYTAAWLAVGISEGRKTGRASL